MPRIDAVILDIGNVLIDWNPERFYDAAIGAADRARLFAEVDLHAMNAAVDRGADLDTEVEALAARHPGWAGAIRMWRDRWLEMASPEIADSVRLMQRLRAHGMPVIALSNFGVTPFEIARAAYPFLEDFDARFISGHLRVMKPEPDIYARLEAETGLAPERLLFTDDRADNIAAADARGWHTHRFTGPQGWAARLADEGLLKETAP